jgi:hypothetical protein
VVVHFGFDDQYFPPPKSGSAIDVEIRIGGWWIDNDHRRGVD